MRQPWQNGQSHDFIIQIFEEREIEKRNKNDRDRADESVCKLKLNSSIENVHQTEWKNQNGNHANTHKWQAP